MGDRLCVRHRDSLDSALLGILEADQREAARTSKVRRVYTRVGHARRRGGKPRRPSGSNRTRQVRAPLPFQAVSRP